MRSNLAEMAWTGILSGLISGLFLGLLIYFLNVPLIQEAEKFEVSPASEKSQVHTHSHGQNTHSHSHPPDTLDKSKLQEDTGVVSKRNLWTFLGSLILGIGYGILFSLWLHFLPFHSFEKNSSILRTLLYSILFSVAGFLIFFGIPALGLPPELPGRLAGEADYAARQSWWYLCVISCFLGFAIFSATLTYSQLGKPWKWGIASFVLLVGTVLPFIYGAPIISEESLAPLDLRSRFVKITWIVNLLFWLCLSLSFFLQRRRSILRSSLEHA
ncbi:CbtA family protein [Leptospira semungkisensis]|uniref:CbtA family protein n=1 Tax=Leptospira semungkisensis TaxID=2484985 RepID=UPI0014382A38|nr:CbtA family protein [Leptospira semungkisensis]